MMDKKEDLGAISKKEILEKYKKNINTDNTLGDEYLIDVRSRRLLTVKEEIALGKLLEPMIMLRARMNKIIITLRKLKKINDPHGREQKEHLLQELKDCKSTEFLLRPDFESARNTLVEHNLRWAIKIAAEYAHKGLPIKDLVQQANIGLLRAAEKFNWRYGYRFTTYATWWIRQTIRRALFSDVRVVYIPAYVHELLPAIMSLQEEFVAQYGYEPSDEELAVECRVKKLITNGKFITRSTIERVRILGSAIVSLDMPIESDKQDITRYNLLQYNLAQERQINVEERVIVNERKQRVAELLTILDERERDVISRRYGFYEDMPQTLRSIGQDKHLSRERIRQIEKEALRKLLTSSKGREIFHDLIKD